MDAKDQQSIEFRSPIAVLHHKVYGRWRVHHLVERDDVRVPHSLEYFYLAADSLYVGYALDAALFQNLDTVRKSKRASKTLGITLLPDTCALGHSSSPPRLVGHTDKFRT